MDRRFVLAIVLMMVVLLSRLVFFPPAPPPVRLGGGSAGQLDSGRVTPSRAPDTVRAAAPSAAPLPNRSSSQLSEDTVVVSSALYRYAFSTRGARMIEASFLQYRSMRPGEAGRPVQI